MNDTSKMVGEAGSQLYDSTATLAQDFWSFYVREDSTTISNLEDRDGNDITDSADLNIAGKTLNKGELYTHNAPMTNLAVSAGSVIIYKE